MKKELMVRQRVETIRGVIGEGNLVSEDAVSFAFESDPHNSDVRFVPTTHYGISYPGGTTLCVECRGENGEQIARIPVFCGEIGTDAENFALVHDKIEKVWNAGFIDYVFIDTDPLHRFWEAEQDMKRCDLYEWADYPLIKEEYRQMKALIDFARGKNFSDSVLAEIATHRGAILKPSEPIYCRLEYVAYVGNRGYEYDDVDRFYRFQMSQRGAKNLLKTDLDRGYIDRVVDPNGKTLMTAKSQKLKRVKSNHFER